MEIFPTDNAYTNLVKIEAEEVFPLAIELGLCQSLARPIPSKFKDTPSVYGFFLEKEDNVLLHLYVGNTGEGIGRRVQRHLSRSHNPGLNRLLRSKKVPEHIKVWWFPWRLQFQANGEQVEAVTHKTWVKYPGVRGAHKRSEDQAWMFDGQRLEHGLIHVLDPVTNC